MNSAFVPITVEGSKLVPKLQPTEDCAGCELRRTQACWNHPCMDGDEHIIYVEEPNVP